jgi:ATP-binding protein involved in chromosome partitioning
MNTNITKEKIESLLKEVQDPELGRDLVSLGMVKEIGVEGGNVFVHLEVTSPAETVRQKIKALVQEKIRAFPGVTDVAVQLSSPMRRGPAFTPKLPLPGIHNIIAVASGKGGVGKTTVAVNLALAFMKMGFKIGLMDGDVYGPNVPLMLGVSPEARPHVSPDQKIIPLEVQGIKMISMGVLVPPDQPMIWRGPMLHSTVTQFLQKVEWGELDILFVDLPPGTGDVQLSLAQTVPLSGAVMVTTPQEVALMDVRKGVAMFRKTQVPILGVVENMTGDVFGRGGGKAAAEQFEVPYLGEIPLDKKVRENGDAGKPIVLSEPQAPPAQAFRKAAEKLNQILVQTAAKKD